MTIKFTLRSKQISYRDPFDTVFEDRRSFLVTIKKDGQVGYGESAPFSDRTESTGQSENFLDKIEPKTLEHLEKLEGEIKDKPASRHAINLARLDLTSRLRDDPLFKSIRRDQSPTEETVPINALIHLENITKRSPSSDTFEDFETIKCKTNHTPAETLSHLENIIPTDNDPKLRIDPNGTWELNQLRDAADRFENLNVEYIEQPLPDSRFHEYQQLPSALPIALDESIPMRSIEEVASVADFAIIKPLVLGGVDRASQRIEECIQLDLTPVVTCSLEGPVGRAGACHLAYAYRDRLPACGLGGARFIRNSSRNGNPSVSSTKLSKPEGTGLGISGDQLGDYD